MIESCDVEVVCVTWSSAPLRTWSLFGQFWVWVGALERIQNYYFLQEKGLYLCLMNLICFVWVGCEGQVLWVQGKNQYHSELLTVLLAYLSLQEMSLTGERAEICSQSLEMIQSDSSA